MKMILFRTASALAAALAACLTWSAAAAESLTVQVKGLRSDKGFVHLGLYDSPKKFPKSEARVAGGIVPATGTPVVYVFNNLKPGDYAVTLYHDENNNDKFDTNWIGLPKEGYGFSNDATPFLSAPSFEEAAVTVNGGNRVITITVSY